MHLTNQVNLEHDYFVPQFLFQLFTVLLSSKLAIGIVVQGR